MPHVRTPERSSTEAWFRGHVLTRFAATVWWVVMVLLSITVAWAWIAVAIDPTWPGALGATFWTLIFGLAIGKEWPNASRMWRMLRHGT